MYASVQPAVWHMAQISKWEGEWQLPQGSNPEIYMSCPSWWQKLERTLREKKQVFQGKIELKKDLNLFWSTWVRRKDIFKEMVIFSWLSGYRGLAGAGGTANYLYYPNPSSISPCIWSCDNKEPHVWGKWPSLAFDIVSYGGQTQSMATAKATEMDGGKDILSSSSMQQACGWNPGLLSSLSKQALGTAVAQSWIGSRQQAFTHVYPALAAPQSSYCTAEQDRMG